MVHKLTLKRKAVTSIDEVKAKKHSRLFCNLLQMLNWIYYSGILVCCILLVMIQNYLLPNQLSTDYDIAVHYNKK